MKTVFHWFVIMVLCLVVLNPAGACAGERKRVRVGVCLSLTDENGEWGNRSLAGIRMRMKEWNSSGGNPEIELLVRDDEGRRELSRTNVEELVRKEKVAALIGPSRSDFLLEERDFLKEQKIIAISPNATRPGIGREGDWIFRLLFDDDFQARAMARHAYENLRYRRAAVIVNTSYSYPESVFKSFAESFRQLGGEIVNVERYSWKYCKNNAYNFQSILKSTAASNPDFVLVPLYAPEVVDVMNASLTVDLHVPFFGTDTWDSELLLEAGGNKLWDAYYVAGYSAQSTSPEAQHYRTQYNMSEEANIEYASILGYDTLSLILHALQDAETPEDMRENLLSLKNHPLASGPITIDPQRGTIRPAYINHITKDGDWFKSTHVDTIWPEGVSQ